MQIDMILLYSGGLDSTLLLEMALQSGHVPYCLLFDYQQSHVEELEFAKRFLKKKQIPYSIISLPLPGVESALTGKGRKSLYQDVSEWYVPARNLIFVAIAASIAESKNVSLIWYGANYEDRINLFPDCYQEWIFQMNEILKNNGSRPIKLEAPLLGMSKDTIVSLAQNIFQIDSKEVFSGYEQDIHQVNR